MTEKFSRSDGLRTLSFLGHLCSWGLIAEALADLFPDVFQLRSGGCWEGSCWFESIDPLLHMNDAYPLRMFVGYCVGLIVSVLAARWARRKADRLERFDTATKRRRERVADRQPAAVAARTAERIAQLDGLIAFYQRERETYGRSSGAPAEAT